MARALIIIPYFGKLPVWFQTFLNSCETNLLDFLVITDDETPYFYPDNFKVSYQSFDKFKRFFKERIGCNMYLEHPYKLCDYKPLYGKVFQQELLDYEYWGHCDIDLVFGDIDHFLGDLLNEGFDKYSRYGHFSLYRNTKEINELFLTKEAAVSFDFVRNTTIPCLFDEIAINTIFESKGKKLVESRQFHNVNMNYKNFAVGNGLPKIPQLIVKKGKKLFIAELIDGNISYSEFFYIHIMRRNNIPAAIPRANYIVTNDGFLPFEEKDLLYLFERYGSPVARAEEIVYNKSLKKKEVKNKIQKLTRELYYYNFKGIFNIVRHFYANK